MSPLRAALLIAAVLAAATAGLSAREPARTDVVVIVNPQSGVQRLTKEEAVNIFMGRFRTLPSGLIAFPIDIGDRGPERVRFYEWLVEKDLAEVDAYWARLVFSGQTSPPLRVPDARTAVELVAGNRAAIAYVQRGAVDGRVRIVLELPPP